MESNRKMVAKPRSKSTHLGCSFFFVKPKGSPDARIVAKRLASIRHVKEVHITEGEYGFVVKSAFLSEEEQQEFGRMISKTAKGNASVAVSHFSIDK